MWLLLALAAALFQVLRNTAMKRLGHALDEYINVWGRFTFLLPFALGTCLLRGWPAIRPGLFTDPGQRWTLVAAFFYAPSVITMKQAIVTSDPATGTLGGYAAASLIITPVALATSGKHFTAVPGHWKEFVALGLFAALTTITQGAAYTMTLSSYVEAVKQVEIIFAMAIGVILFGEAQRVRESAVGAVVMLVGMALLVLAK